MRFLNSRSPVKRESFSGWVLPVTRWTRPGRLPANAEGYVYTGEHVDRHWITWPSDGVADTLYAVSWCLLLSLAIIDPPYQPHCVRVLVFYLRTGEFSRFPAEMRRPSSFSPVISRVALRWKSIFDKVLPLFTSQKWCTWCKSACIRWCARRTLEITEIVSCFID